MRISALIGSLVSALLLLSCAGNGGSSNVPGPEVLDNLSGNYALKTVIGPETHYSTAVVKEIADGQFQIARITVYGPVLYSFKLNGAAVQSPELGSGEVRYKADIKKITIHFEKENSVCELSR